MKKLSSAVITGMLVLGSAAIAAAQTGNPPASAGDHQQHMGRRGGPGGPGRGRGGDGALLHGMTLSDAEKANLKSVHEKYATQMKAMRDQFKPQAGQPRPQRGDTAAMRQRMEQNAPQREAMRKLMEAQQADLRAALSPENQARFDANVKEMKDRLANGGGHGRGGRGGRGFGRRPDAKQPNATQPDAQ